MSNLVKNGNACIGCNLLEEFPCKCGACGNFKSRLELVDIIKTLTDTIRGWTKELPTMPGFYLVCGDSYQLAAELIKYDYGLTWATTEDGYRVQVGHDKFAHNPRYKHLSFEGSHL